MSEKSLNRQIAELLAPHKDWVVCGNGDDDLNFTNNREWVNEWLMVGKNKQIWEIPDYENDVSVSIKALQWTDVTVRLDLGVPETAYVIPEGRVDEPPLPEFKWCDADVWAQEQRHADIAELLARATLDYLKWRESEGGA